MRDQSPLFLKKHDAIVGVTEFVKQTEETL
jgi:hypothetical protein